jgi:hypothetical protein
MNSYDHEQEYSNTSNDKRLNVRMQRRRNNPRLLFGSKITWLSSITTESNPPSIPDTTTRKLPTNLTQTHKTQQKELSKRVLKRTRN